MDPVLIEVAVPVPLRKRFTYQLPQSINKQELRIGQSVIVPFAGRQLVATVLNIDVTSTVDLKKTKAVISLYNKKYSLPKSTLSLLELSARYYHHPIGDVIQQALPVLLRQIEEPEISVPNYWRIKESKAETAQEGLVQLRKRAPKQFDVYHAIQQHNGITWLELKALGFNKNQFNALIDKELIECFQKESLPFNWLNKATNSQNKLVLSAEQALIVSAIKETTNKFSCHLVDGITGSGKTEVYLQAMEEILEQGNQVLVLVPEIGLTPQTLQRFSTRFKVPIFLHHSGLNDKERLNTWYQAKEGQAAIVIGTRSSIFCPLPKLGLIIVDEEHDSSFKQQDTFRYNARDIAILKAKQSNIPIVLGSATPSLESLQNAIDKKYHYHQLRERAGNSQQADIALIDTKQDIVEKGLTSLMVKNIKQTIDKGEQVLIFLNRRGYAPAINCKECHWIAECSRCNKPYTLHQSMGVLICHHCASQKRTPHQCGQCGSIRLAPLGIGTEQLDEHIATLFPEASTVRIDRDSTRAKGALATLLNEVNDNKHQILIGTQMLAKGHHFPNVTLVAILDIDGALFSYDFRAPEYMAQLLVQVAGRSGRASKLGKVLIQTQYPEHPLLQDLVNNGYEHFAKFALTERKMAFLPPFGYQAMIRAEANYPSYPEKFLRQLSALQLVECEVAGPMPAIMAKKAGKFRYHLILQAKSRQALHQACHYILHFAETLPEQNKVRWTLDIDPTDFAW